MLYYSKSRISLGLVCSVIVASVVTLVLQSCESGKSIERVGIKDSQGSSNVQDSSSKAVSFGADDPSRQRLPSMTNSEMTEIKEIPISGNPEAFWQRILAERSDLDDSDTSKLMYINERLGKVHDEKRFECLRFLLPIFSEPLILLESVTSMRKAQTRDSYIVFKLLVEELKVETQRAALVNFVDSIKADKYRKGYATIFLSHTLDQENFSQFESSLASLGRDKVESVRLLDSVFARLVKRWKVDSFTGKTDFDNDFIEQIAQMMPKEKGKQLLVENAASKFDGNIKTLVRESARLGVSEGEMIQVLSTYPDIMSSITPEEAFGWLGLLDPGEDMGRAHARDALISRALLEEDRTIIVEQVSLLPTKLQVGALETIAVRLAVDSGRQEAYNFATGLTHSQLEHFIRGLSLAWEDSGSIGPSLEEFNKLSRKSK